MSGFPVTVAVPDPAAKADPVWWSSSSVVGDQFIVKFAWSRPAALRLAREFGVVTPPAPALGAGRGPPCARRGGQRADSPRQTGPGGGARGRCTPGEEARKTAWRT